VDREPREEQLPRGVCYSASSAGVSPPVLSVRLAIGHPSTEPILRRWRARGPAASLPPNRAARLGDGTVVSSGYRHAESPYEAGPQAERNDTDLNP
jgi:hypothetical protein